MPQLKQPDYRQRQADLRKVLADEDVDFALFNSQPRLRYLCGYTGSNGLLIVGHSKAEFYTDSRYTTQAKSEVKGAKVAIIGGDLLAQMPKIKLLQKGRPKVAYERSLFSEAQAHRLHGSVPNALFVGLDELVAPLMALKDQTEIAAIEKAVRIADYGFSKILEHIRPGVREHDVAAELEYIMKREGSEGTPFDTICASGPRSALPHGRAAMRKIRKGDFVTLDFGAIYNGYVSDMTRTVIVGQPTSKQKRVYEVVRRAQDAAVRASRPGITGQKLDEVARKVIDRAGFGKQFGHGLGHGIGLEVHEGPGVNPRSKVTLRPGMVITIEPGVYIPNWGGVRIEDDVVITRSGHRVLTQSEKKLIVL
ncbi:MAG: Xaa-Pro peptidase family protein [Candidatus Zixiibacteriota bacterium]